jgi:hypothetical protein
VQVVAAFAGTGITVGLESFLELVKDVGLGTEMAETVVAGCFGFIHGDFHGGAIVLVVTVALNHNGIHTLAQEDMLKRQFHSSGARTG